MRMLVVWTVAVSLAMVAALPASADKLLSTRDFVNMCQSAPGSAELAYCNGYIAGVASEMQNLEARSKDLSPWHPLKLDAMCIGPKDFTEVEIRAFIGWVQEHPQYLDHIAGASVLEALSSIYHCPDSAWPRL